MTELKVFNIKKGFNWDPRDTEMLKETNDLTIGQTFCAVALFHGKDKSEYPRWISYQKNPSEFSVMQERVDACATDLEKIQLVCDWLGEEFSES